MVMIWRNRRDLTAPSERPVHVHVPVVQAPEKLRVPWSARGRQSCPSVLSKRLSSADIDRLTSNGSFVSDTSSVVSGEATPQGKPFIRCRIRSTSQVAPSMRPAVARVEFPARQRPNYFALSRRVAAIQRFAQERQQARAAAARASVADSLFEESQDASEASIEFANKSPRKKTCSFVSKSVSKRRVERAKSCGDLPETNEEFQLEELEELLVDPEEVKKRAGSLFKRHVAAGSKTVTMDRLEPLLLDLGEELEMCLPETPRSRGRLVRARMRKFDSSGLGELSGNDFEQMYLWSLWRKHEDLNPPIFARSNLVTNTFEGNPTSDYEVQEELGKGQYGVAHRVVNLQTSHERAMKTIKQRTECVSDLRAEVELLALLDHPHILRLFELYIDDENLFIITDLCYGGEMLDIVKEHAKISRPLPESWVIRAFSQTLCAVAYCHMKGVVHKDLKFENLMLRKKVTCDSPVDEIHVVIIDVGMSELFGDRHGKDDRCKDFGGTLFTMAPEVFARDFSQKCDIWSIGCLLFAMFNTKPLYVRDHHGNDVLYPYPFLGQPCAEDPYGVRSLRKKQKEGPSIDLVTSSEQAKDVILRMLAFRENERPSALECLQMPWFTSEKKKYVELSNKQVRALVDHAEREARLWWAVVQASGATQLPMEEFEQLSELFTSIGANGTLSVQDLSLAMQRKGVSEKQADEIARCVDVDGSGHIEWSEFVAAMLPACHLGPAVDLTFKQLDWNNDGQIDRAQLLELLKDGTIIGHEMSSPLAHLQTDMLLYEMGTSEKISIQDFQSWFEQGSFYSPQPCANTSTQFSWAQEVQSW